MAVSKSTPAPEPEPPSEVVTVDYDPFAGASEARQKFLKGEMTWKEYTQAERPPQEQRVEEQPES